jgi:sulfate permease, SulP family
MRHPRQMLPFLDWLPLITRGSIQADTIAALTAAVVVLPQAIAFATIAGLPIEYGFYTALVSPIFAALFGSSRHMISGPTTAISVLLFASLSSQYEPGSVEYVHAAIALTFMAGVFQLALGVLRLGALAHFVSPAVMTGFTAGAAVIILVGQLPSALGIETPGTNTVLEKFYKLGVELGTVNIYAAGVAICALAVSITGLIIAPRWPYYLIAIILAACMVPVFGIDTQDLAYIPSLTAYFPTLAYPPLFQSNMSNLAQSAFAVALVGLLEATAISRSLAVKSGQDIDVNQEFIGQGVSNVVGSFFSTYVASGSFTRSAVNYDAGARTPLAAILASLFLLLLLLLVGQWIQLIPIAAIAGIIMLVAYRLVEFGHIRHILRTSKSASAVMIVTFIATLLVGLEVAIISGVIVSLTLYLRSTALPYLAITAPDPDSHRRNFRNARAYDLEECPQLAFGRIDGQLYFGSLDGLRQQLRQLERQHPEQTHLLLLMKGIGDIDMHGAQLIIEESQRRRRRGGALYISARRHQIGGLFRQYGILEAVGSSRVFTSKGEAIETIVQLLDDSVCAGCEKRIFNECPGLPPIAL